MESVNAQEVCKVLEDCGMKTIAIHGRTRSQGYSGEANWEVIDACTQVVDVPIIGNGDIATGEDVEKRRNETGVSGVMIGRAAMQNPWVFREAKHYLATGEHMAPPELEERWTLIRRHCLLSTQSTRYGNERQTMMAMRSRLMAYCKGFPGAKPLRRALCAVSSLTELEDVIAEYMKSFEAGDFGAGVISSQ